MSMVKRTTPLVEITLPPLTPLPTGGRWSTGRTFDWCRTHETETRDDGSTSTAHIGAPVPMPTPPGLSALDDAPTSVELYYNEGFKDPQVGLIVHVGENCTHLDAAGARRYVGGMCTYTGDLAVLLKHLDAPVQTEQPTPQQVADAEELIRIAMEADDPVAAAGRALELTAQVRAAQGCDRLHGRCRTHIEDHGEVIHRGAEHTASGGGDNNLLAHSLVQWGDDKPFLEFIGGGHWEDLDLHRADQVIAAVEKQLASLRTNRAHLAAALAEAPPAEPPEGQKAQQDSAAAGQAATA